MRERTARGHDLSERDSAFTQPPRPYHFVWLNTGRTVRIEYVVHLSTNLTEGRLRFLLGYCLRMGSGPRFAPPPLFSFLDLYSTVQYCTVQTGSFSVLLYRYILVF